MLLQMNTALNQKNTAPLSVFTAAKDVVINRFIYLNSFESQIS